MAAIVQSFPGAVRAQVNIKTLYTGTESTAKDGDWEVKGNAYFQDGITDNLVFRGTESGGTCSWSYNTSWGITFPSGVIFDEIQIKIRVSSLQPAICPHVGFGYYSSAITSPVKSFTGITTTPTDYIVVFNATEAETIRANYTLAELNSTAFVVLSRFQNSFAGPNTVSVDCTALRVKYHTSSNATVIDTGFKSPGSINYDVSSYTLTGQQVVAASRLVFSEDQWTMYLPPNTTSGQIEVRNITGTVGTGLRGVNAVQVEIKGSVWDIPGHVPSDFKLTNIELWSGGSKVADLPDVTFTTSAATYILVSQLAIAQGASFNYTVKFRGKTLTNPSPTTSVNSVKVSIVTHRDTAGAESTWQNQIASRLATQDNVGTTSDIIGNGGSAADLDILFTDITLGTAVVIEGIQFDVDASVGSQNGWQDSSARIMFKERRYGYNKATNQNVGTAGVITYGGPHDTWGLDFADPELDFTAAGFGLSMRFLNASGANGSAAVDYVKCTVYYTSVILTGSLSNTGNVNTATLKTKTGLRATLSQTSEGIAHAKLRWGLRGTVLQQTNVNSAYMLSGTTVLETDWHSPGTAKTTVYGYGADPYDVWSNINSMKLMDGLYSTAPINDDPTGNKGAAFVLSNFGFSIPSASTIEQIFVRFKGYAVSTSFQPTIRLSVQLSVMDPDVTWGPFSTDPGNGDLFPTSDTTIVYDGLPYDYQTYRQTWGYPTLAPADINSPNFGIHGLGVKNIDPYDGTMYLDSVQIKVRYHLPSNMFIQSALDMEQSIVVKTIVPIPLDITKSPATTYTDLLDLSKPWTDLSKIKAESAFDVNSYAFCGPLSANQQTNSLMMTGWGITRPMPDAVPRYIQVHYRIRNVGSGSSSTYRIYDDAVHLIKGSSVLTSINKAQTTGSNNYSVATNGAANLRTFTATDIATLGITPTDIEGSGFGFFLRSKALNTNTASGTLRLFTAAIEIQWDVFTGTITTLAVMHANVSTPVPITGGLTVTQGIAASLPIRHSIQSDISQTPTVRGLLGIPFKITGTLNTTNTVVANLKIGIERHFVSSISGALAWTPAMLTRGPAFLGTLFTATSVSLESPLNIRTIATTNDMAVRTYTLLPRSWFGDIHPWLNAVLQAPGNIVQSTFVLIREAGFQIRLRTAMGGWLDLWANDFFGDERITRRERELDGVYRDRIIKEIFRERDTRRAIEKYLQDLTGRTDHDIVELWRPLDTGAYGLGYNLGYGVAGHYGSQSRPYQAVITARLPGIEGIPFVGGYGTPVWGYGEASRGVWGTHELVIPSITAEDIYEGIASIKPAGTLVWVSVTI